MVHLVSAHQARLRWQTLLRRQAHLSRLHRQFRRLNLKRYLTMFPT